ncbi:MAG TPA: putative quinol monooxygenase [Microbacterium sp.]|nr:putative quinol monooxygenase [Microbacterium sp.]
MPIVALVEFRIMPASIDDARAIFEAMLAQTRRFDGADRIDWLVDRDDPAAWTLYEEWRSAEAEQAYRAYRMNEGAVPELGPLLDGPPRLRRFDAATDGSGAART